MTSNVVASGDTALGYTDNGTNSTEASGTLGSVASRDAWKQVAQDVNSGETQLLLSSRGCAQPGRAAPDPDFDSNGAAHWTA